MSESSSRSLSDEQMPEQSHFHEVENPEQRPLRRVASRMVGKPHDPFEPRTKKTEPKFCENCELEQPTVWHCSHCSMNFCDDCWDIQPPHKIGRVGPDGLPHEKADPVIVQRLKGILNPSKTDEEQQALHVDDEDTTWIGIAHNDLNRPVLQDYGRYSTIMAESNSGEHRYRYPQLVSFIGQTGAGKSTLIKMLIDRQERNGGVDHRLFPTPVVGTLFNNNVPTTSDVHLYSDPRTYSTQFPMLYADCEGLEGGENIPIAIKYRNDLPGDPKRRRDGGIRKKRQKRWNTTSSLLRTRRVINWADSPEREKRQYAVTELYPRLLYTFSDVIVFVLRNPRTFETTAFSLLIDWTLSTLEKSLNQPTLPHAVIVLNATDSYRDKEELDPAYAAHLLMSNLSSAIDQNPKYRKLRDHWISVGKRIGTMKDLLECYYSSITVVQIPVSGRYMMIDKQVEKLHAVIAICCKESFMAKRTLRMLYNSETLNKYLQHAFDSFTRDLHTPFDFLDVSLEVDPLPMDLGGNILKLAVHMKSQYKDPKELFKQLSFMVSSCLLLDCARKGFKDSKEQTLDKHDLSACNTALEDFCAIFWPCSFIGKRGERCVNVKDRHSKGHQDQSGRIIGVGHHEANFTFDNFAGDWLRYLQTSLSTYQKELQSMMMATPSINELLLVTRLHHANVYNFYRRVGDAQNLVSQSTCFCCLIEPAEHQLQCGHFLCTLCIKDFGQPNSEVPAAYTIALCPLHANDTPLPTPCEIYIKPSSTHNLLEMLIKDYEGFVQSKSFQDERSEPSRLQYPILLSLLSLLQVLSATAEDNARLERFMEGSSLLLDGSPAVTFPSYYLEPAMNNLLEEMVVGILSEHLRLAMENTTLYKRETAIAIIMKMCKDSLIRVILVLVQIKKESFDDTLDNVFTLCKRRLSRDPQELFESMYDTIEDSNEENQQVSVIKFSSLLLWDHLAFRAPITASMMSTLQSETIVSGPQKDMHRIWPESASAQTIQYVRGILLRYQQLQLGEVSALNIDNQMESLHSRQLSHYNGTTLGKQSAFTGLTGITQVPSVIGAHNSNDVKVHAQGLAFKSLDKGFDDDIRSLISDSGNTWSTTEGSGSPDIENVIVSVLSNNSSLAPLFKVALQLMPQERFSNNFGRMLNIFRMNLIQKDVQITTLVASHIKSRAVRRRISQKIVQRQISFGASLDEEALDAMNAADEKNFYMLERWFNQSDIATPNMDSEQTLPKDSALEEPDREVEETLDDEKASSDDDEAVAEPQPNPFPRLDLVIAALVEGFPFQTLLFSLKEFLLPHGLLDELWFIPRENIWYHDEKTDLATQGWSVAPKMAGDYTPGSHEHPVEHPIILCANVLIRLRGSLLYVVHKTQAFLEDVTALEWNWWPLPQLPWSLDPDRSRVYWKCFCGTVSHRDLKPEQKEILDDLLNSPPRRTFRPSLCANLTKAKIKHQQQTDALQDSGKVAQQPSDSSSTPKGSPVNVADSNPDPDGRLRSQQMNNSDGSQEAVGTASTTLPIGAPPTPSKRLSIFFGVEGPRKTPETDLIEDSYLKSDPVFLRKLHRRHRELRGLFRWYCSIWRLEYWDFVKFEKILLQSGRAIVRSVDLPTSTKYEYTPRPPDVTPEDPGISRHEFKMIVQLCLEPNLLCKWLPLHDCLCIDESANDILSRLPKRHAELTTPGQDIGDRFFWGIQARYCVSAIRVIFVHFLAFTVPFGLWGWWQYNHPDDLQGAAVPFTVTAVFISMFWSSTGVLKVLR